MNRVNFSSLDFLLTDGPNSGSNLLSWLEVKSGPGGLRMGRVGGQNLTSVIVLFWLVANTRKRLRGMNMWLLFSSFMISYSL